LPGVTKHFIWLKHLAGTDGSYDKLFDKSGMTSPTSVGF
jgi:hypothetical protein